MDTLQQEYEESMKGRIAQGFLLAGQSKLLFDYTALLQQAEGFASVLLSGLSQRAPHFHPKAQVNFAVRGTPAFQKRMDLFCEELAYLKQQKYRVLILAGSGTRAQRMAQELTEQNLPAVYIEDLDREQPQGTIWMTKGALSRGFQYDFIQFAVFSDNEIFGKTEQRKRKKKKKTGEALKSFSDLHIGDYVVHDNHGIGIFRGLEKIRVDGVQKDYMKISYRDGGNLFVPVNQMDLIQKYIGAGGAAPKLNKLGGQDWLKAKTKARKAVKILAEDLVALYAKRAAAQGYCYHADTIWQKEFEEAFEYEPTPDQIKAKRSDILLEMSKNHQETFEKAQLGQTKEILMEEEVHGRKNWYTGHTREYVKAAVYSEKNLENQMVNVQLETISPDGYVEGKLVPEEK